jgi:predicted negative regulator of RcsB-dependent stress response
MAANQEAETIEKALETTLEKTDFGHIINENKRPILIVGAIILLLIIGYSVMETVQSNKRSEKLDSIFKVEQSVFNAYLDGKSDDNAFKTAFASISNEFQAEPNLVPPMMKAINKLEANKALDQSTLDKVTTWLSKMDKKNYLYLFTALRVAAIYEDHNQINKSIALLDGLIKNNTDFMLDRIHFDLGRFYLATGEKDKAKNHFNSVISLEQESEFKSVAKIYLSEL